MKISRNKQSKIGSFDFSNFVFGKEATDHLFSVVYRDGKWQEATIEPYHNLSLSPLSMCLHYGQTVFEGLKAYRMENGEINIFRLEKHGERINKSLKRMAMPEIPLELFVNGISKLVETEQEWVRREEGYSLYIRPFMIATEDKLGVDTSSEYHFLVVCCPMKAYYSKPLKVKVERRFTRAAHGGTGSAKNGGNYGTSLLPAQLAKKEGFDQVLWLDAASKEYFEESGTMNLAFIVDGEILTPALGDTVLDGVTRDSLVQLARKEGLQVTERPVSVSEIREALSSGKRVEAFGVGTAAVIAPFESISIDGEVYPCYHAEDALMFRLKALLSDVRHGKAEDVFHWNYIVPSHAESLR